MEPLKSIAEIIEALATTAALVVAGLWSYRLFVKKRLGYPRLSLELEVNQKTLPGAVRFLHAEVRLRNTGLVM